jgi:DNA-binding transcriptional MerR regulator
MTGEPNGSSHASDEAADSAGDPGWDDDAWRIDDLAQRASVSVDTIRYYQREGLLPAGERVGRTMRFGQAHLEQLERIRGLQARRFSLAAIRALLEHDGSLEGLLAAREGSSYDPDELQAAAGASPGLLAGLEKAGFLRAPADFARDAYDGEDLDVLRAFADLGALGVPEDVLVAMAVVLAERIDQLQHAVLGLFTGRSGPGWTPDAMEQFQRRKLEDSARLIRDMRTVMNYVQHRNFQRIVLEELRDDAV